MYVETCFVIDRKLSLFVTDCVRIKSKIKHKTWFRLISFWIWKYIDTDFVQEAQHHK